MKYADIMREPAPQTEALDERQVMNNAGGFVFAIDDWARLDRFLILGSDAPTYYQAARALTRENAKCVERCLAADAPRTIARAVEDLGRRPCAEERSGHLRAGAGRSSRRPEGASARACRAAEGVPHRDAPVPVRQGCAQPRPRLGPVDEDGDRQLVQHEVDRRRGVPGREVPRARGLLAQAAASDGAPGRGRCAGACRALSLDARPRAAG